MSRYENCDETCTVDCGHCKGRGLVTDRMPVGTVLLLSHPANNSLALRTTRGWHHTSRGLIDFHTDDWWDAIAHGAFTIIHRGQPWPEKGNNA